MTVTGLAPPPSPPGPTSRSTTRHEEWGLPSDQNRGPLPCHQRGLFMVTDTEAYPRPTDQQEQLMANISDGLGSEGGRHRLPRKRVVMARTALATFGAATVGTAAVFGDDGTAASSPGHRSAQTLRVVTAPPRWRPPSSGWRAPRPTTVACVSRPARVTLRRWRLLSGRGDWRLTSGSLTLRCGRPK